MEKFWVGIKQKGPWISLGLPLVTGIVVSCLPLSIRMEQALIGIMLIWFQISLMTGHFK